MTRDTGAAGEHSSLDGQSDNGTAPADLTRIQRHVVELLAQLDRPPRTLKVQVGAISVDISWQEAATGMLGTPTTAAQPVAEVVGPSSGTGSAAATGDCLSSPGVGVFYHASAPGDEPFVSVGTTVRAGQQIGIIEAMKLMIPVEADRAGRITAVLKGNGEPVEYGEPLFALDAEGL